MLVVASRSQSLARRVSRARWVLRRPVEDQPINDRPNNDAPTDKLPGWCRSHPGSLFPSGARLPATVPSIAQNIAVASRARGSSAQVRGSVICGGVNGAAGTAASSQRFVEIDETGAGENSFRRDMIVTSTHKLQYCALERHARGSPRGLLARSASRICLSGFSASDRGKPDNLTAIHRCVHDGSARAARR